jgi:hypothetical protein
LLGRSRGEEQQERNALEPPGEVEEPAQRRLVCPV